MSGLGKCNLCQDDVPTADLVSHLSVMHPDAYEPFETWPDGSVVVVDTTLEPHEFGGDAR